MPILRFLAISVTRLSAAKLACTNNSIAFCIASAAISIKPIGPKADFKEAPNALAPTLKVAKVLAPPALVAFMALFTESKSINLPILVFLSPENAWPAQIDVITSYFSYCFHYPKEKYWTNILSSLKIGGKLILDVRMLADRDVVEEITEDMKCQPTIQWFDSKLPAHVDNMPSPKEGMPVGGRFIWTRNK